MPEEPSCRPSSSSSNTNNSVRSSSMARSWGLCNDGHLILFGVQQSTNLVLRHALQLLVKTRDLEGSAGRDLVALQEFGHVGDGRGFQHRPERERRLKDLTHAGDNLRGHERMASQFKEVVEYSNLANSEHVHPYTPDNFFDRIAWRGDAGAGTAAAGGRRGEHAIIELAVPSQRQGIESDIPDGLHI